MFKSFQSHFISRETRLIKSLDTLNKGFSKHLCSFVTVIDNKYNKVLQSYWGRQSVFLPCSIYELLLRYDSFDWLSFLISTLCVIHRASETAIEPPSFVKKSLIFDTELELPSSRENKVGSEASRPIPSPPEDLLGRRIVLSSSTFSSTSTSPDIHFRGLNSISGSGGSEFGWHSNIYWLWSVNVKYLPRTYWLKLSWTSELQLPSHLIITKTTGNFCLILYQQVRVREPGQEEDQVLQLGLRRWFQAFASTK